MRSMLDQVGAAILKAHSERAYGLYDYSNYPGLAPPHVVRDEKTGKRLHQSWDEASARSLYEQLCREYVAQAAISAMDQWRFEAAGISAVSPQNRQETEG